VKAARSQILTKRKQRRQIKIHRYAMDKEQREIGWSLRRREKCAMQAFVIGGFKCADFGLEVHWRRLSQKIVA
jgi:hypothetical protein